MNIIKINKSVSLDINEGVVFNNLLFFGDKYEVFNRLKDKKKIKVKHIIDDDMITITELEGLSEYDIYNVFGLTYNIKLNNIKDLNNIPDDIIGDKFIIIDNILYFNNKEFVTDMDIESLSYRLNKSLKDVYLDFKYIIDKTNKIIDKYDIRMFKLKANNPVRKIEDIKMELGIDGYLYKDEDERFELEMPF